MSDENPYRSPTTAGGRFGAHRLLLGFKGAIVTATVFFLCYALAVVAMSVISQAAQSQVIYTNRALWLMRITEGLGSASIILAAAFFFCAILEALFSRNLKEPQ